LGLFENRMPKKKTIDCHYFPIEIGHLGCIPHFETHPNLVLAALGQPNLNPAKLWTPTCRRRLSGVLLPSKTNRPPEGLRDHGHHPHHHNINNGDKN
jgi:hypothetical protein